MERLHKAVPDLQKNDIINKIKNYTHKSYGRQGKYGGVKKNLMKLVLLAFENEPNMLSIFSLFLSLFIFSLIPDPNQSQIHSIFVSLTYQETFKKVVVLSVTLVFVGRDYPHQYGSGAEVSPLT